jgi:hypothetical protein
LPEVRDLIPRCGYQSAEEMPADACRFCYTFKGCGDAEPVARRVQPEMPVIGFLSGASPSFCGRRRRRGRPG